MSECRAPYGRSGSLRLVLDLPLSCNRHWRQWRGRTVLTPEAREYREAVGWAVVRAGKPELSAKTRWTIEATFHMPNWRMDMLNGDKELLDSLAPALGLDDRYLVRALFVRAENDPETPRVDVEVGWGVE